ncbi:MAG: glycosyltransferase family 4 protein [Patescibacteria group bacterium]
MKNQPQIFAFMNAYSQGKSGGDMVFIEVAKRIKQFDKVVVTSLLGKDLCQKNGLEAKYLITTRELEFRNVIWTYIKRTINVFFLKLKPQKSDILLGTSDFLPDVLPIFWLKFKNKKTRWIQHIFHLISSSRKIPFYAQKISLYLIKQWADLVVVDNNLLKKNLAALGFELQRIAVNHPGINLGYLKSIKAAEGGYDGIFMAQLRPAKGIFDLIKIWKLVCQKQPKATLGIIGKGEKEVEERLKREIKVAGIKDNVDLLGYLEDDEAFTTIKASRVFIFPSHEEGFGITPLEAQALGLPVVAWDLPVFGEIFSRGMVKLKIGQVEKFADEVISLLKNRGFYQKMSKEAVENSNRFDWGKTAKQELELIEKLTK